MPYLWFGTVFYLGFNDLTGWIIGMHIIFIIVALIISAIESDGLITEIFQTFYGALTRKDETYKIDDMVTYILALDPLLNRMEK